MNDLPYSDPADNAFVSTLAKSQPSDRKGMGIEVVFWQSTGDVRCTTCNQGIAQHGMVNGVMLCPISADSPEPPTL